MLSIVLTLYKCLINLFKLQKQTLLKLVPAIQASINKLEKYLKMSRTTRVYALAMVLNPKVKFQWLEKNWTPSKAAAAKKWVLTAVMQISGTACLDAIEHELSLESVTSTSLTLTTTPSDTITLSPAEREMAELEDDKKAVLNKWQ
ncbi:hypothetical protein DXG03_005686, partial [Asterophora parasitica]